MIKNPGTLAGCAIGDALGIPFEMKAPSSPLFKDWDGSFRDGGTFHKESKAGMYSDDTLMTMCLARSLIRCNGFDPEDVAKEYLGWFNSGNPRGMGSTIAEALFHLKMGSSWKESGMVGEKYSGNGTAMRASPIGLFYRNDIPKLIEVVKQDAIITHNSLEPQMGSIAMAVGVALLLKEQSHKKNIIPMVIEHIQPSVVKDKLIQAQSLIDSKTDHVDALAKIGTRGYVPETVGAAFYCFVNTHSFKDAVLMAVRSGGDADTTAACAGALAGTYYGVNMLPDEYKSVEDYDLLNEMTLKLISN